MRKKLHFKMDLHFVIGKGLLTFHWKMRNLRYMTCSIAKGYNFVNFKHLYYFYFDICLICVITDSLNWSVLTRVPEHS